MRPAGRGWVLPCPAALWVLLLAGHVAAAAAPVPALLEAPARLAAVLTWALSSLVWRFGARLPLAPATTGKLESALGFAALIFSGVSLGAEADRRQWPLPVHPRETRVVVEGIVLDATAVDARSPSVPFEVHRVRVGEAEATCRARVTLRWMPDDPAPGWVLPGQWLRLAGAYRPPEDARNFGGSAPGRWAERAGLSGTIRVDARGVVAPAEPPKRGARWDAFVRDSAARAFARRTSQPVAALARGMLLGDRSGIGPDVRNAFRDGGTIHVLSISGLHVVILAGFIAASTAALRLPAGPSVLTELVLLWGYVFLVGAPASALRSGLLWTAVRSGRASGRVVRPFAAWGLAGLALHLLDPRAVLDPGFQLSFAAVLGLGASGALAVGSAGGQGGSGLRALGRGAFSLFVQSAGASAGTAAMQGDLFGAVPLSGLLLNLAVIPLCTVFMAESILTLAADLTGIRPLAVTAGGALDACGLLLLWLHAWGAHVLPPWIVRDPAPVWVMAISFTVLLAAWAVGEGARAARRGRRTALAVPLLAFGIALGFPVAFAAVFPTPSRADLVIVSLDVGQGDATWIGLPGHDSFLIDAGSEGSGSDAGSSIIEPALRAERSGPLSFALLSHDHSDHYGGFPWLASRGWMATLYENGSHPNAPWRRRLRGKWRHAFARPVVRDTLLWDKRGTEVEIRTGLAEGGENDRSLTTLVRAGRATALFPGDLETRGEEALLRRAPTGESARIVKAPHHGSTTSSGADWVARWAPDLTVVSCGEGNRFHHPCPVVVGRYLASGSRVLRTDREGSIRITVGGGGAWISTRADPEPRFLPWRRDPG